MKKLFLEEILIDDTNGIDIYKITKEFIINSNDEEFEYIKRFLLRTNEEVFYLYSHKSLEVGRTHVKTWIDDKYNIIERLEYLYSIMYNDMFDRSAQYDNNDIVNFQIAFNDAIRKNKDILKGLKVK